jgi:catechol 2,3-dioxygenase-like lactoylglutathione lyase family enzyme
MHRAAFAKVQPILGTRDLARAAEFYVDRLGFQLAFGDPNEQVGYVGFRRDQVELHMQFQYEHEMGTTRLRIVVDDPDALFDEYKAHNVLHAGARVADTPWHTREFAIYDLDCNALTFYRRLQRSL